MVASVPALSAVLGVSVIRNGPAAAYELGASHWTDRASGIGALVLVALGLYAGTAFLIEESRGESGLLARRGSAAEAMRPGPSVKVEHSPHEPGVRDQL